MSGRVSVNVENFAMLPESKKGRVFGCLVYYEKKKINKCKREHLVKTI